MGGIVKRKRMSKKSSSISAVDLKTAEYKEKKKKMRANKSQDTIDGTIDQTITPNPLDSGLVSAHRRGGKSAHSIDSNNSLSTRKTAQRM